MSVLRAARGSDPHRGRARSRRPRRLPGRELWELTARARGLLIRDARPEGFTIGINDGLAAGQTVPHAHIHVIPRHIGDVADPTGGIRAIVSPRKARYWEHS
jgi:diadenosine tetraphosphate (Ap4A) HIT family hydrolase